MDVVDALILNNYHLRRFDAASAPMTRQLVELHCELLPTSPISRFGRSFMERVFYSELPSLGAVFGAVAVIGGRPAGFVAATDDSARFMRKAFRQKFFEVGWAVGRSVLARPARIRVILEIVRLMHFRRVEDHTEHEGEILSMGVRPEFRDPKYFSRMKINFAQDLLDDAVRAVKNAGCRRIRAVVDADNSAAQFFYSGNGWRLTRTSVPGWIVPSVEFSLDL